MDKSTALLAQASGADETHRLDDLEGILSAFVSPLINFQPEAFSLGLEVFEGVDKLGQLDDKRAVLALVG
jgi:hypothetical protein